MFQSKYKLVYHGSSGVQNRAPCRPYAELCVKQTVTLRNCGSVTLRPAELRNHSLHRSPFLSFLFRRVEFYLLPALAICSSPIFFFKQFVHHIFSRKYCGMGLLTFPLTYELSHRVFFSVMGPYFSFFRTQGRFKSHVILFKNTTPHSLELFLGVRFPNNISNVANRDFVAEPAGGFSSFKCPISG